MNIKIRKKKCQLKKNKPKQKEKWLEAETNKNPDYFNPLQIRKD